MTVRFTPEATRDITNILANVTSPQLGERLSQALGRAMEICHENPRANPKTRVPFVRRCPLRRYRYTIFYSYTPGLRDIEIIRVVHSARVRNLDRVPKAK